MIGRVIPYGARWFYGLALIATGAALAYGWGSRGGLNGVLTAGLMGAIGEHNGMVLLLSVAVTALFVGGVVTAVRDADPDVVTATAGADVLPEARPPADLSHWPLLGALGVGITVVGLVVGSLLTVVGLFVVGIALVEWAVQAWADRASGDPQANREIRNRLMYPIEFPVAGALGILLLVLCVSRVLLALPKAGSNAVAIAFASLVLLGAALFAYKPKLGKGLVAVLAAVLGVAVIAGGIIAAAEGSRTFAPHEEEHEEAPEP